MVGLTAREVFPDLEGQHIFELLDRVYSTGEPFIASELPLQLESRGQPTRDAQGRVDSILVHGTDVTAFVLARRRAEAIQEELRRQEDELQLFKAIIEASTEYIAFAHSSGNLLYVNPAGRALVGLPSLEAARAAPLSDSFTPEFAPNVRGVIIPRILQEKAWTGEVDFRHFETGETIPMGVSAFLVPQEGGRSEVLAAIGRDLRAHKRQKAERERLFQETERLRARAEQERTRLDAFFMQAPVAIASIRGPQFVIDMANPRILQLWGRPHEQIIDRPLLEAIPELRGQGIDTLLQGVMATGVPFVATELPVQVARDRSGVPEARYFDLVYEPLRDPRGVIEGVLTVATEVTQMVLARREREAAFTRLQQAERSRAALMEAITEQSFIAVAYMRGPQHVFETDNAVYRKLVGKSDVLGKPLLEAIPELAGQGIDTLLTRVLQTGEPFTARELSVQVDVRGEGVLEDRLFDFVYQPVRAADGSIEGVLDLAVDVTEQVQAREAVRKLAEEQRTRLEFEQQLIGIVSHDLRNPLSVILFGTQSLLNRGELEPRVARTLGRIQASAERATRMVRDLLDFTQARLGGGLQVKREPQSLHDVTRAAVEELRAAHPERELRLELTGEARGEWDADRLSQVVGNLVSNAVKYSTPGTPVTVKQSASGDDVLLEVHNQGNPIPPEAHARLFQPLQRAVATIDKESRSVGLGLYIVEQIIRAHQGLIDVVSTEAQGTTFRVRLPSGP